MANENDRSEDIKKMVEINPSNTKKKRRKENKRPCKTKTKIVSTSSKR